MPDNLVLIIIASNEFRDAYLKSRKDENIQLINSTLITIEEPMEGLANPWTDKLQGPIIKEIKKFGEHTKVRVAGHIGPCFGRKRLQMRLPAERVMRDHRLTDKEEMLKEAFGSDLDIQIWGFHQDEQWSSIWRALTATHRLSKDDMTDEERRVFEEHLIKAFEDAQHTNRAAEELDRKRAKYEHLAFIVHNINRQLTPLRISLDSASEKEEAAAVTGNLESKKRRRDKAERLREEVSRLLPEKLETARAILEEAASLVRGGKNNEWWKMALQKMSTPPAINYEEFCKWIDELGEVLKNLVEASDE